MPKRKGQKGKRGMEKLKWEVARDLNLDDDLTEGGERLSKSEVGQIGGQMVKKLVKKGKEVLEKK